MGCNPLKCICGNKTFPQRYMIVIFISVALIIAYGQRVNISMVIAEMSEPVNITRSDQCNRSRLNPRADEGRTKWTQQMQGVLLSGFFWGYLLNHIPGGYIGDRWGARYVLTTSVLVSSFCTVLFPIVVTNLPFPFVVFCRVLIGLAQGSLFPNMTTLMSRWIPLKERAFMGGITFAAGALGIILGKLVSGVVYVLAGDNWRLVFYVWGIIGLTWYLMALLYVFSGPMSHPFISTKEKEMLAESIPPRELNVKLKVHKVLFDPAVLSLLMGQFGHDYLIFFLATNMPKYFSDVQNLQMKDNMWASSIPYSLMWLSSVGTGRIADWQIRKGRNVALVRKLYTTIASLFPSIGLVLIPYMGCNEKAVISLMCFSLLTMGPFFCGLKVNIMDLTQNYSGLLMAIVNGFGALAGVLNPPIIGFFATDALFLFFAQNTFPQWKAIMWLIFSVASVTNILYVVGGKADRREWDMNEEDKQEYLKTKAEKAEEKKRKMDEKLARRT